MDSNGTNIVESVDSSAFSFKLCFTRSFRPLCTDYGYPARTLCRSSTLRPEIHQTSISIYPKTLSNENTPETVVNAPLFTTPCTSSISSSVQSQNMINATETVPLWRKYAQDVAECLIRYQEQVEYGGCGLENFGNSCYVNSALQCLGHIHPFIDIILNLQKQQQYQLPLITSAYAQLLTKMQSIHKGSTSAHELKVCISDLNRRFVGTDEQDSHEFLTVLLEALHDELMDNYQDSSIGDLMHGIIRSTIKCLVCGEETYINDSFLSLPLSIRQSDATGLELNIIHDLFEKFIGIFVSRVGSDSSIRGCFEAFLSIEPLGENGQWYCEICKNLTNATKRFDLWHLPKVLILQLKRFTSDLTDDRKTTTKIRFDLHLNLSQFINKDSKDQLPLYDLVASVTHSGTLASGHYTTFAKHLDNGCWYHFDDQHVRQTSTKEVLTSDAYVLVYERR